MVDGIHDKMGWHSTRSTRDAQPRKNLTHLEANPDRRVVKVLHQMEIPPEPKPRHGTDLFTLLCGVLDERSDSGLTVALLLTRPGSGPISDSDRRWSTMLTETAARFDVPIEPIFRANDEALVLVEPIARAA